MHLHFVCTGNSYRSRLAEAYCDSLLANSPIKKQQIKVSSSGTEAARGLRENRPICWYTMRLIKRHQLMTHMSLLPQQTTQENLAKIDLLVCMQPMHLDYCQKQLGYTGKFELWRIPDLGEMEDFVPENQSTREVDLNHIELSEKTFEMIRKRVEEVVERIVSNSSQ